MNVQEAYEFTNKERLALLSTVTDTGQPQSALLGMAVTQPLEIIFDKVKSSRKYPNLKKNPRVAWVLGCTTEVTVQYEGVAEGVSGRRVGQVQKDLFRRISGWTPVRESWPGITYFVVRPTWVRYCDYNPESRRIEERKF
jgi:general stress protein 26